MAKNYIDSYPKATYIHPDKYVFYVSCKRISFRCPLSLIIYPVRKTTNLPHVRSYIYSPSLSKRIFSLLYLFFFYHRLLLLWRNSLRCINKQITKTWKNSKYLFPQIKYFYAFQYSATKPRTHSQAHPCTNMWTHKRTNPCARTYT